MGLSQSQVTQQTRSSARDFFLQMFMTFLRSQLFPHIVYYSKPLYIFIFLQDHQGLLFLPLFFFFLPAVDIFILFILHNLAQFIYKQKDRTMAYGLL